MPYADGNANMAITYNEDGSKKVRKGNKKPIALIRRVEDMKNLNESDISEGLRIIDRTSGSRKDKRKRMGNFLNDVTGRNLL